MLFRSHTSGSDPTYRALEQSNLVDHVYPPAIDHTQAIVNAVTLHRVPDPDQVPHEAEATLTVEGFLRSAATVKASKRYRNRLGGRNARKEVRTIKTYRAVSEPYQNHTNCDQCGEPPSERRKRQIEWTSDDEEYVPEEPAKKRRRRKKTQHTQPLSIRLLKAAVVTGVDVGGGLLSPDAPMAHTSTVLPLPLSLGSHAPSPVDVAKSRRRQFVDPRKVDRADSQFVRIAEDAPVKQVKEQRPITAWEPEGHAVQSSSLGNGPSGPGEGFVARPLTMVSSKHPHSALRAR